MSRLLCSLVMGLVMVRHVPPPGKGRLPRGLIWLIVLAVGLTALGLWWLHGIGR